MQLGLLDFSQQTVLTDYGQVTVAPSAIAKSSDNAGALAKNSDSGRLYPVTIRWAAGSHVGVIHGQWKRLESGEIEAVYNTPFELRESLQFSAWQRGEDLDELIARAK